MSTFKIFKETAMPAVIEPNSMYVISVPDNQDLLEIFVSNNQGTLARHVINKSEIETMIEVFVSAAVSDFKQELVEEPLDSKQYTHIQLVPSQVWNITHNLNTIPSVTVIDSSGQQVVGDIIHNSAHSTTIMFSAVFSGSARLI